jgi:hypothetical protein
MVVSGIEVPTERIAEICKRYSIRELAIFGSAARGAYAWIPTSMSWSSFFPASLGIFSHRAGTGGSFWPPRGLGNEKVDETSHQSARLPEARVLYAA